MLAAVESGNAKKLAELMRQDPGFKVNMAQNDSGWTLLHYAWHRVSRFAVIPLLLAHPGINVNVKDMFGQTPFYFACSDGNPTCVREMLKDSRVKEDESDDGGETPLRCAACDGHLEVIRWWIASGREMDLGTPGDIHYTDAIGTAMKEGETEVVTLLERFKENPEETRYQMRVERGFFDELALRCSPWWSLSLMAYFKSTTPLRPLQPGSSSSPPSFLWNSKWCCASARWDQPRRLSQAKTARWHSRNWPGNSGDLPMEPTSLSLALIFFASGCYTSVFINLSLSTILMANHFSPTFRMT